MIAACSRDKDIKLFDISGDLIATLIGHETAVTVIAANDRKLASGGRDTTTKVWDVETN
jgi:WD40 repeat protein